MYKLIIVDDEQIEREGMAQFIPWDKYDVELVGTAWNGLDGFEQIQEKRPDIVLTETEEAMSAIGELTGRSVREDVTNRIFERFCVGK